MSETTKREKEQLRRKATLLIDTYVGVPSRLLLRLLNDADNASSSQASAAERMKERCAKLAASWRVTVGIDGGQLQEVKGVGDAIASDIRSIPPEEGEGKEKDG